jgi:DNA polymerase-3 subunit gamma/tau
MREFARQIVRYLRGVLLTKAGAADLLDLPLEAIEEVKSDAKRMSRPEIVRALRTFGAIDFRNDVQSSLPLELALIEFVSAVGDAVPAEVRETVSPKARAPAPAAAPAPVVAKVADRVEQAKPQPEVKVPVAASPAPPTTAPDDEPAVQAPAASGDGDLIVRVRAACAKPADNQLSGLLNGSCEITSNEGDTVVMGFYHTFHLERIENGPLSQRLQELFSQVLGKTVDVKFEHVQRQTEERPKPSGGHLVRAARELGARPKGPSGIAEGGQSGEGQ